MTKRSGFKPGELDALLAEGERSGKPLDGRAVFKELNELCKRAKSRLRKHRSKSGPRVSSALSSPRQSPEKA